MTKYRQETVGFAAGSALILTVWALTALLTGRGPEAAASPLPGDSTITKAAEACSAHYPNEPAQGWGPLPARTPAQQQAALTCRELSRGTNTWAALTRITAHWDTSCVAAHKGQLRADRSPDLAAVTDVSAGNPAELAGCIILQPTQQQCESIRTALVNDAVANTADIITTRLGCTATRR